MCHCLKSTSGMWLFLIPVLGKIMGAHDCFIGKRIKNIGFKNNLHGKILMEVVRRDSELNGSVSSGGIIDTRCSVHTSQLSGRKKSNLQVTFVDSTCWCGKQWLKSAVLCVQKCVYLDKIKWKLRSGIWAVAAEICILEDSTM